MRAVHSRRARGDPSTPLSVRWAFGMSAFLSVTYGNFASFLVTLPLRSEKDVMWFLARGLEAVHLSPQGRQGAPICPGTPPAMGMAHAGSRAAATELAEAPVCRITATNKFFIRKR